MAIIKSRRQVVQWLAGLLATPWKALGTASAAVSRKRSFTVPLADDDGNLKGSYPASTLYFTEDLGAGVTLEMALIPGGEFRIGSGSNVLIPPLNITEQPVHAVSVNPFVLGVFPVTQEQWRGVAAFPVVTRSLDPGPDYVDGRLSLVLRACEISREAFQATSTILKVGLREFDAAAQMRSNLLCGANANERCDGFAYCMSGPNSAHVMLPSSKLAVVASRKGSFVLLHCNSYCGGFWTDVTRTFSIGRPDAQAMAITDAVLEATGRAIDAIRPGARASGIDTAAREVLKARGYANAFRHATGHGVGFAAINHDALPRIHPLSDEILEPGMVFNIEPAVRLRRYC